MQKRFLVTIKNLQMHMLRVVVCSKLIIYNWGGSQIDKEAIITV